MLIILKQTIREAVNKIFIEQNSSEPKVKVFVPMCETVEVSKCEKCGKVITELNELINSGRNISVGYMQKGY